MSFGGIEIFKIEIDICVYLSICTFFCQQKKKNTVITFGDSLQLSEALSVSGSAPDLFTLKKKKKLFSVSSDF